MGFFFFFSPQPETLCNRGQPRCSSLPHKSSSVRGGGNDGVSTCLFGTELGIASVTLDSTVSVCRAFRGAGGVESIYGEAAEVENRPKM